MKRTWTDRVGIVAVAIFATVFSAGTAGNANAADPVPSNPEILKAIQNLQKSVNTLRTSVNNIQNAAAPRRFYLTKEDAFDGLHAPTACAAGFHMASLFEIFDPHKPAI